jgi:hypothetical protein
MHLKNILLTLPFLLFLGCGEDTVTISSTVLGTELDVNNSTTSDDINVKTVTLSGVITYDSVPFAAGGQNGLDYNNIEQKPVRGAEIEVVNAFNQVLATTTTDESGAYSIPVSGTEVKVRVLAKLYKAPKSGESSWDFEVRDNTNGDSLYAMEGSLASLGTGTTQTRNLNAPSGWNGSSYNSERVAGPFSILDVVYTSMQKVNVAEDDKAVFADLDIFWSEDNVPASGNRNLGQIITSHYDGESVYILGKADIDSDEYDTAVVAHEWGHYYEDVFSRSDSIGGVHGPSEMLDIRLAFGEGFGTAFGCMMMDTNLYLDSMGTSQATTAVFDDIETSGDITNPGWFNEGSIYNILYDIYDSNDDEGDSLSLGFTPIHQVLMGAQKETNAFTSIFSFITALKTQFPGNNSLIDAITSQENIAPITDAYGTGRVNRATQNANPLYADLTVGGSVNIVTNYSAISTSSSYTVSSSSSTRQNELGTYNFVKFEIPTTGTYTFNISPVGGSVIADPDFYIYTGSSSDPVASSGSFGTTDSLTTTLSAGTYRMAVIVYNQTGNSTFKITLN